MRASRQLKPETFPFLAVLLCAMGSLILLLLVMDRRAKAVARAKAARAAIQATETNRADEEKRRAEEEKRREEARRLREQAAAILLEEEARLREQVTSARSRADAAAAESSAAEEKARELQAQLATEQQALSRDEAALKTARQRAGSATSQAERARTEAAQLAAELHRLEQQLAALKAKRQREQQTYSLVPYRGKQGDNRKPLYLECGPRGLVFYPDRLTLEGADLSAARLREEVQRRVARMAGTAKRGKEPVYLFFLVRPDGITRYYETVSALSGLDVDFGYELVEQDWVLDFSESSDAARPWADAGKPTPGPGVRGGTGGAPRGITFGKPEPPSPQGSGDPAARQPGLTPGRVFPPGTGSGASGGVPRPPGPFRPFAEGSGKAPNGEPGSLPPSLTGDGSPAEGSRSDAATQPKAKSPATEEGGTTGMPGQPEKQAPRPRVVGTRELVFRVECKADEVVLYPGGARFSTSLVGKEDATRALAQAVAQMIGKRQASVRPGEAAYRPQVRFLVRPDGLRSFFLAYPAMEPLKVPMTRQDLEADEELP